MWRNKYKNFHRLGVEKTLQARDNGYDDDFKVLKEKKKIQHRIQYLAKIQTVKGNKDMFLI